MKAARVSPVAQAYASSKPGREALFEIGRAMECTEDKCGIVWERFVVGGESLILVATPHWWDVYAPLTSDGEIAAVVAAIKARAVAGKAAA